MVDSNFCIETGSGQRYLFVQDPRVQRQDEQVVDVEALARVSEHADKIIEIGGLMSVEEVFLQIERFEDEIGVLLAQPVFAKERVITRGNVGPGGVEDS